MKRQGIRYLITEQKARFLKTLKLRRDAVRSYMMYDLMLNTGLRLAELVALNVGSVQDRTLLEIHGKGSKIREIPLNRAIREHIQAFLRWKVKRDESLAFDAPLFISRKHSRISARAIQRDLTRWIQEAGIEGHYSPHALRHTVGTELLNKTGNLRVVQEFLGHADISTTQIYTHVSREQIQQAADMLAS